MNNYCTKLHFISNKWAVCSVLCANYTKRKKRRRKSFVGKHLFSKNNFFLSRKTRKIRSRAKKQNKNKTCQKDRNITKSKQNKRKQRNITKSKQTNENKEIREQ